METTTGGLKGLKMEDAMNSFLMQYKAELALKWLSALFATFFLAWLFHILKQNLYRQLHNRATLKKHEVGLFFTNLINTIHPVVIFSFALYLGTSGFSSPTELVWLIHALPAIACIIQVAFWVQPCIDFFLTRHIAGKPDEIDRKSLETLAGPIRFVALFTLYSLLFILALDNLNVDVTTLITGLGIGGIAVALAVQKILGDLFASFSIALDKPFVVGDVIAVAEFQGHVQQIGLKTTRIKSISGEEVSFANSDLINSRIRNFTRMAERRAVFQFSIAYNTPYEKVCRIPEILREIMLPLENIRFDRAHFARYNDNGLLFEAVYFVLSPDYNLYMNLQETINLALFQKLETEQIEFSVPLSPPPPQR